VVKKEGYCEHLCGFACLVEKRGAAQNKASSVENPLIVQKGGVRGWKLETGRGRDIKEKGEGTGKGRRRKEVLC
jgi:hypothetical protein